MYDIVNAFLSKYSPAREKSVHILSAPKITGHNKR